MTQQDAIRLALVLKSHSQWLQNKAGERANLSGANLSGANLSGANLSGANLARVNFARANLAGVDLYLAINIPEAVRLLTQIVPDTGAFTAWKKLRDDIVAELAVPARAKRSNATGRKCRVSEARVKALYDKDGHPVTEGRSLYDESFIYTAGCTVKPQEAFDDNRWNECGSGIFCFITRAEAEAF